jgi:anti-sigma regulatory factor (Ser/Thr protein kinase)
MENQNTDLEPIRVKIVIPTNVYFLSGIRNFSIDMARNVAGFDEQWAHRMQTVVDELVNNAIEHGSRQNEEIELAFEVERQKSVTVTVIDHGHGPTGKTAAELNEIARTARENAGKPNLALRGRGFQIISQWSDSLTFADNEFGGISARAEKIYQPSTEPLHAELSTAGKNVYVLNI